MRLKSLVLALGCAAATLYGAEEFQTSAGSLKITPVTHASLMIEAGGKVIHLDPYSRDTQEKYAALPKADLILITDFHPDHMDATAIGWL